MARGAMLAIDFGLFGDPREQFRQVLRGREECDNEQAEGAHAQL